MKISVNIKYAIIQGLFWMLYGVATGFISLYLLEVGVSNSMIGVITALFGIISACLQPTFGRISDRNIKASWKKLMLIFLFAFGVICILMLVISGAVSSAIFIGLLILLGNLILPFMNSALFYYQGAEEYVNFGIARGIGSAMYAVLCLMVGNLALVYGTKVIPALGIIVTVLMFLVVYSMPYDSNKDVKFKNKDMNTAQTNTKVSTKNSSGNANNNFIKKYPFFILMILGFVFLSSTHNVTNTYLLQIIQSLGGNSKNLGIASAIMAIVEVPVLFCYVFLQKRFTVRTLMMLSAIGYCFKATCFVMAASVSGVYLAMCAQMFSFAIFASASVYYTGEVVDEEDTATGQAIMASVMVAGTVIGSLIGGWALDAFGIKMMLVINVGLGLIGLLIVASSVYVEKRRRISVSNA